MYFSTREALGEAFAPARIRTTPEGWIMPFSPYDGWKLDNGPYEGQTCPDCGEYLPPDGECYCDEAEAEAEYEDDGQPSELTEWLDYDPDC